MKRSDPPTEERPLLERSAMALGKAIHNDADAINDLAGVFNDYEAYVAALQAEVEQLKKREALVRRIAEEMQGQFQPDDTQVHYSFGYASGVRDLAGDVLAALSDRPKDPA